FRKHRCARPRIVEGAVLEEVAECLVGWRRLPEPFAETEGVRMQTRAVVWLFQLGMENEARAFLATPQPDRRRHVEMHADVVGRYATRFALGHLVIARTSRPTDRIVQKGKRTLRVDIGAKIQLGHTIDVELLIG